MTLKENNIVVIKSKDSPHRNITSATCSSNSLFLFSRRIDKNDRKQLAIKSMIAANVISSTMVFWDLPRTFKDVSTIKQRPSRLEDALRMWGDLSLCSFIS